MPYCSAYVCNNSFVRNVNAISFFSVETTGSIEHGIHNCGYFCSLGPHLEKNTKMVTYDDQTSQGVSATPVLCVCTCYVIKKL